MAHQSTKKPLKIDGKVNKYEASCWLVYIKI